MARCKVINSPPVVAYSLKVANKLSYLPRDQHPTLLMVELLVIQLQCPPL